MIVTELYNLLRAPPSPVNAKHLYDICTMSGQRRRRWCDIVQMLYKCYSFHCTNVIQMFCVCWDAVSNTATRTQRQIPLSQYTQTICITFCTNIIQMFCVCWDAVSNTAPQRQTEVADDMKFKKLLLFVFARHNIVI